MSLHIEKLPEGVYLATSDDIQGLIAQGRAIQETLEIAHDVARKLLEARSEREAAAAGAGSLRLSLDRQHLMGRLADFKYRDIVRRLKQLGFEFDRQAAGSHEIWYNPAIQRYTTLSRACASCSSAPVASRST